MDIHLSLDKAINPAAIKITGSKSETNRLLLLQALYPEISIKNYSDSDDSAVMQKALAANQDTVNVGHAGTAMRFLTAYYAIQQGNEVIITGSERMQERPIAVLADSLKTLGADIKYIFKEGFPPLKIRGKKLTENKITINASVSSQYITALLLIAAKLENGLEITLKGAVTSLPYIHMTLSLLEHAGIQHSFINNTITVMPAITLQPKSITVESDWSSASYYYSVVALSPFGITVTLSSFKQNSRQGDSKLVTIYKAFGVETVFNNTSVTLTKTHSPKLETLDLNLNDFPDLAQTIAVTCFGMGTGCNLTGLHTLKIKETDRLTALKSELEKLGASVIVTNNSLLLKSSVIINTNCEIETYNDHRMAMAFAPLAVKVPIIIKNAGVVSKSYPAFWNDFKLLGFTVDKI